MTDRSALKSGGRRPHRITFRTAWLGLLATLTFLLVLQISIAGAFRATLPQIALNWVPLDAEARSRAAAALVERGSPEARETAHRLALEAVRRDALSPIALRVLAQSTGSASDAWGERATGLMFAAERLTRRDRAAQLWFVQYYIRRDDVRNVMRHFDIALRTSDRGQGMVFPLLAAAASEPRLERALVGRLNQRPVWTVPFMVYLIDEGPDPARTVAIARAVLNPRDERDLGLIRSLLQRLGSRDHPALAWDVYTHFGLDKKASGKFLQAGNFDSTGGIEPFAWMLVQDADLWAARQRDANGAGSVLQLGATAGKSGEVARQLVRLPRGVHRLDARMGAIPADRMARPRIDVRCAGGAQSEPLASLVPTGSGPGGRRLTESFAVPANCEFQWVSIHAAGETAPSSDYPWVDDIGISPVPT